ncbi:MAG: hypothetical protein JO197_13200 [Acidobacteria bacterium]|nr:hypothetical protein [Acidobacteriota bacterium]MBV9477651.1 hypothetical protein [Acidobacteriota bacterium]
MTRRLVLAACVLAAISLQGREMIVPVVTGLVGARVFSTTVEVKNASSVDGTCVFTYRGPDRVSGMLISKETVRAGKTNVYEDFLGEIAAAGSVATVCSDGLEVFARVQDADARNGASFRPGRLYRAFDVENALIAGAKRTLCIYGAISCCWRLAARTSRCG